MKYNTILTPYPHHAAYQTWEEETNDDNGNDYRVYNPEAELIQCRVAVSQVGTITLFAKQELQVWGIVQGFIDAAGEDFFADTIYVVLKAAPLVNPMGYVYGYFHTLTIPTTEQLTGPINLRPGRDWLDQMN